uniref:Uncharacterized protein n=1 Tax=Arundo donax TaxID=35708 RepID=A0A0A9H6K9_ARUDO
MVPGGSSSASASSSAFLSSGLNLTSSSLLIQQQSYGSIQIQITDIGFTYSAQNPAISNEFLQLRDWLQ